MSTHPIPTPAEIRVAQAAGFVEQQSAHTYDGVIRAGGTGSPPALALVSGPPTGRDLVLAAIAHVDAGGAPADFDPSVFVADRDRIRHVGGPVDRSGRRIPPPPAPVAASFSPDTMTSAEQRADRIGTAGAAGLNQRAAWAGQRPVDTARLMSERTSCLQAG